MISEFGNILVFLIAGLVLLGTIFGATALIRPQRPSAEKLSTYESGEAPEGNANVQFNVRYYILALVFILFEVEILFLFPWATVFGDKEVNEITSGLWAKVNLIEIFIFIFLLLIGLVFAWVNGLLDWVSPEPITSKFKSKIPSASYYKFLKTPNNDRK